MRTKTIFYTISIIVLSGAVGLSSRVSIDPDEPPEIEDSDNKPDNDKPEKKRCRMSRLEADFMKILKADRRQKRASVTCHPTLLKLARERAKDMATRGYFSHTNPDGHGPNYLLQKMGYRLPSWWGKKKNANYIESISGGRSTARSTYTGWMNSSGHKKHVLALSKFYAGQTNVAIGHYRSSSSRYNDYWVFISAPPEE